MRSTYQKAILVVLLFFAATLTSRAGSIVRSFYDNVTGTLVYNLITNTTQPYPDNPDASEVETAFFEGSVGANGVDNFGSLMRGWITAPQTGNYIFWCNSDDSSELWLSTDATPTNKRLIAIDPVWSNSRDYDQTARRTLADVTLTFNANVASPNNAAYTPSANLIPYNRSDVYFARRTNSVTGLTNGPITLTQGNQYYVEMIEKEGGTGDNSSVGWQLPDGTRERPMNIVHVQNFVPTGTTLNITGQPQDTNVVEAGLFLVSVTVDAVPPVKYVWFRNGNPIPVGVGSVTNLGWYAITNVTLAMNNDKFKVIVTDGTGASLPSEEHVLTVAQDVVPPSVLAVSTRGNPNAVQVQFSEPVTDASATLAANYSINQGVTISSVVRATNGTTVVYQLNTSTMVEGKSYTVTVNNIKDLAATANTLAANTSFQFFLLSGTITRNYYDGIGGNTDVPSLTNNAAYIANTPTSIAYVTSMGLGVNNRGINNYGSELVGYFTPPISGAYSFFISSDDNSYLLLSTDANPANKHAIAREEVWANYREWTGNSGTRRTLDPATGRYRNQSADINLLAGQKYFIQGVHKEGGGGDSQAVAWVPPGGNSAPTTGDGTVEIPGSSLSSYNNLGPVVITNLTASQTVGELASVTFRVRNDGTTPYTYQWQKSAAGANTFANIAQTAAAFTLNPAALTDAGDYRVIVGNWFSSATSAVSSLTVTKDIVAPTLSTNLAQQVTADLFATRVQVWFSENMYATNTAGVTNLANYTLTGGLTVTNVIRVNGTKVILQVTPQMTDGATYTLTVKNLQDLAATPNLFVTTNVTFQAWVQSRGAATMLIYTGANSFANLTNATGKYINKLPDDIATLTAFDSRLYYPDDSHENYGATIVALLYPPLDGDYRFFIDADDAANLYLSSDTDPANAQLLCSSRWQDGGFNTSLNGSAPVTLKAGQAYAIYTLMFEGTGGDHERVGWRIPGEDANDVTGLGAIPGSFLSTRVPPANASVTFTQQPVSITVAASSPASFTARASATSLFSTVANYQWQKAPAGSSTFTNIPGAAAATYNIKYASPADTLSQYRSIASIATQTATSQVATLTVGADITAPKLVAVISVDGQSVTLVFNEPMSVTPGMFTIPGVTISGAAARATAPQIVDLQTTSLTLSNKYTIAGNNVTDLAGNKVSFNSGFVAQTYAANPANLITMTTNGMLPSGSLPASRLGFNFNNTWLGTNQSGTSQLGSIANAEAALSGALGPSLLTGSQSNFTFNGVINFDHDNPIAANGRVTGETQFPDQLAANMNQTRNNHAMEILSYVNLTQGIHRWGVNSDDGFQVSSNPNLVSNDPNQVVLGFFDAGRGAADTRFDFVAPADGLYPIRLVYFQGIGGANLEWWEKDITIDDAGTGPWLLINGTDGGPAAYTATATIIPGGGGGTPPGKITVTKNADGTITLSWATGSTGALQSASALSNATVWSNVSGVTGTSYTTSAANGNLYYRVKQ